MPGFEVIADVSETLRSVLDNALNTPPISTAAVLHDLQGTISTSPPQLTIFLYEVAEDPTVRNRPRVRGVVPPDYTLKKPPMALILRYLLTPWSGDRLTDHKILGRTLQLLYDDAILRGGQLQGVLAGTDQAIKLTLAPLTLEERSRIWYSVQKPYHLSLTYEARVVNLDAEQIERRRPVSSRVLDKAVPEQTP